MLPQAVAGGSANSSGDQRAAARSTAGAQFSKGVQHGYSPVDGVHEALKALRTSANKSLVVVHSSLLAHRTTCGQCLVIPTAPAPTRPGANATITGEQWSTDC